MERKGHGKALEHLIPEILALGETEFSRDRQSLLAQGNHFIQSI